MPEQQIDQKSGRAITYSVIWLANLALIGGFALVYKAMSAPDVATAVGLMGVAAGFMSMAALLIGGLVNAMTIRSGSTPEQLAKTEQVRQAAQESMSAGYLGNVSHDSTHPTAQMFASSYVEPNTDPSTPGPTIPT